jgi:hypothetical protein
VTGNADHLADTVTWSTLSQAALIVSVDGLSNPRSLQMRSFLYALARFLGDVEAARRGRVRKRVARRLTGRGLGRLLRKLFG